MLKDRRASVAHYLESQLWIILQKRINYEKVSNPCKYFIGDCCYRCSGNRIQYIATVNHFQPRNNCW